MSDKEFLMLMGAKIRVTRKACKMSLRDLEKFKMADFGHLSRIENGQVALSIITLKKIAEALQVDIKEFL